MPAPPAARKPRRRWLRRLLKWTGITLLSLVTLVILIVIFLPLNWIVQSFVLPAVHETFGQDNITIGRCEWSLTHGVEFHEIRVGPPAGYTKDILTLKRMAVHYDLFSYFGGDFQLTEVAVEQPHAFLEIKNGKSAIDAMLEKLPPPEPPPPEPPPGEPPDLKVTLHDIHVTDARAGLDDGTNRVDFKALDLKVSGVFSFKESKIRVEVGIGGTPEGQPNVIVAGPASGPQALAAELEMKMKMGVDIGIGAELDKPRADVDLDFLLASTKLEAAGLKLKPLKLTANTKAMADIKADQAGVKLLTAHFNGEELLRMKADLNGLKSQAILAQIEKARLPFAVFLPYVEAVLPPGTRFDLKGEAGLEGLSVAGEGPKLSQGALPTVTGRLFVRDFAVDVDTTKVPPPAEGETRLVSLPPLAAQVKDVNVEIDLGVTPDAPALDATQMLAAFAQGEGAPKPTAMLKGTVGVGLVDGFGAHVEKLALDLTAGAVLVNQQPQDVAAQVSLKIPTVKAEVPGKGKASLSLATTLRAGGNLPGQNFVLDKVTLNVSDTIKVAVDGWVKKLGNEGFELNTRIEPLNIPRALAIVPAGLRPPGLTVGGSVDTTVHVKGTLPPMEELQTLGADLNKAFALPVELDITQGMNGLSVALPAAKVQVAGFSGAVRVHGKPSDITIEAPAGRPLGIDKIVKSDLGVVIRKLALPLKVRFTPLSGGDTLALETGASMKFEPAAKTPAKGMALSGGLSTKLKAHGHLPPVDKLGALGKDLGRALALPFDFDLEQRFDGLSVKMPAAGLDVRNVGGGLRVHGRPGDIKIGKLGESGLTIDRIGHDGLGMVLEKLGLPLEARLTPLGGPQTVDANVGVTIGAIRRKAMGLRVEGLEARLMPRLKLPVLRALGGGAFDIEDLDVGVQVGLESLSMKQPGQTIRIAAAKNEKGPRGSRTKVLRDTFRLNYDPKAPKGAEGLPYSFVASHELKLGNLHIKESRLEVKNLVLGNLIEVAGLSLSGLKLSNPVPASKPRYVRLITELRPNRDPDADGTDAERRLALSVGGTPLDRAIAENELNVLIRASLPRLRYPPLDQDVFVEVDRVDLDRVEFHNKSHGARVALNGQVKNIVVNQGGAAVPLIDLSMFAGVDLPPATEKSNGRHMLTLGSEETHDKLSLTMGGKVGLEARIRNLGANALEVKGVLVGDDCHIWTEKHGQDPSLADGTQLFTVQNAHVKNLTMAAPMIQRIDLDYLSAMAVDSKKAKAFQADVTKLWPAARDIFAVAQSPLHHTMQSYSNVPANLTVERVDIDKQVDYVKGGKKLETAHSPLVIDRVALNMGYENWVFDLKRLYIQMMGGDIGGRVAVQLKGLAPPDLNMLLQTQIGGINLAALNPRRDVKKKYGRATEVKVDANLAFGWRNRDVDGSIKVSKLSLKQLDEVLKFSDPGGRNQQIQDQRSLFQNIAFLNPSVKYVNLDFEYANMDLETRLDAIPGVRGVLNAYLEGIKVQGLDARQVVENFIAELNFIPPVREPPEIGPEPDDGLETETETAEADTALTGNK